VTGSVSVPLIRTKITIPPLRPQMVVRKRLFGLLDDGIKHPLTLISAPAGSGKTSLITSWVHEHGEKLHVAWVSLDDDERDPVRLLSYIIAKRCSFVAAQWKGTSTSMARRYRLRV
jgi:ATP/maltotriose-dependent transcriptional regulator MalT